MLTRLLPEQVSKLWNIIKYAIEESLPPLIGEAPDKMNRILSSALSGKLEVWVSYTQDRKFEAVLVTKVVYDEASNVKNLLLYCLYGFDYISSDSYMEGAKAIKKYAESKGCISIVSYTSNPLMIDLAKRFDADLSTFVSVPLSSFNP